MEDIDHQATTNCLFYVLELVEKRTVSKGNKVLNRFRVIDKTSTQEIVFFSKKNEVLPISPHEIVHAKVKVYAPRGHSFRSYNIQSILKTIK